MRCCVDLSAVCRGQMALTPPCQRWNAGERVTQALPGIKVQAHPVYTVWSLHERWSSSPRWFRYLFAKIVRKVPPLAKDSAEISTRTGPERQRGLSLRACCPLCYPCTPTALAPREDSLDPWSTETLGEGERLRSERRVITDLTTAHNQLRNKHNLLRNCT